MTRPLPFAVVLAISLVVVSLLPLYVEQTMTHVMFADGSGGAIEWGWQLCMPRIFFSDYRCFRHHPHPELWIALNIGFALTYALVMALLVRRIFRPNPNAA